MRPKLIALGLAALLAAASLSFSCGRTLTLADETGAPIDSSYVAYTYLGTRPNPAHVVSYQAKRTALARGDRMGRVVIPGAFHRHLPFPIETPPTLWVELVYVPRLHNGVGQTNRGSPSTPGVFALDFGRSRAIVSDLAARPELWEGTLGNLSSLINKVVWRAPGEASLRITDPETAAFARELIGDFRLDYEAFLARYGNVVRPRPEIPPAQRQSSSPDELQRWEKSIDADLAREPTWGMVMTRLFGSELRVFSQWEIELK